jgi:hypothetical protein
MSKLAAEISIQWPPKSNRAKELRYDKSDNLIEQHECDSLCKSLTRAAGASIRLRIAAICHKAGRKGKAKAP